MAAEDDNDKLLLAARKMRRTTSTDFLISLVADDFSRASNTYVGKLRSASHLIPFLSESIPSSNLTKLKFFDQI